MKKRIIDFFEAVFDYLTATHPIKYLCIYLVLVPAFAAIYLFVPSGFYAPYARLEREGKSDAREAGALLQTAIRRQLTGFAARPSESLEAWQWDQSTRLFGVSTEDGSKLSFKLDMGLRDSLPNQSLLLFSLHVTMRPDERWESSPLSAGNKFFRVLDFDTDDLDRLKRQLPPTAKVEARLKHELERLEVTTEEEQSLKHFFDGMAGEATATSGSFLRMCYFSSMVVTTVGFGDIVPITPVARSWVALEALSGIVLIGLFINAISWRSASRAQNAKSKIIEQGT